MDQRFCKYCDVMVVVDKFHFRLVCPQHDIKRLILFKKLTEFTSLSNERDVHTFIQLMNCCQGDTEASNLVCQFVEKCFPKYRPTMSQSFNIVAAAWDLVVQQNCSEITVLRLIIETKTQWPPFSWRHFHICIFELSCLNFYCTEVCSIYRDI